MRVRRRYVKRWSTSNVRSASCGAHFAERVTEHRRSLSRGGAYVAVAARHEDDRDVGRDLRQVDDLTELTAFASSEGAEIARHSSEAVSTGGKPIILLCEPDDPRSA